MNKQSFKRGYSEFFLISKPVYEIILKNLKDKGDIDQIEKMNKDYLYSSNHSIPIPSKKKEDIIQTDSSNTSNIGMQTSIEKPISEVQTEDLSIQTNQPMKSDQSIQSTPKMNSQSTQANIINTHQSTQTNQNQNVIPTQTNISQNMNSQSTQSNIINDHQSTQTNQNDILSTPTKTNVSQENIRDENHSQIQNIPIIQRDPFTYQPQPYQTQNNLNSAQTTTQINTDAKENSNTKSFYKCDYCTSGFTRLFSKNRHMKNIHGMKNRNIRKRINSKEKTQFNSKIPKLSLTKKSQLKSKIPRPIKNFKHKTDTSSKKKVDLGILKSKIPRLIPQKFFKKTEKQDTSPKRGVKRKNEIDNQSIKRKKPEIKIPDENLRRGTKRKKDIHYQSKKKRKTFENWN